jgi:hypothetical protein
MKNITITMIDDLARWVRVEAAKKERSVSRFVADAMRERKERNDRYTAAMTHYLALPTEPPTRPRQRRALRSGRRHRGRQWRSSWGR